MKSNTDYRSRFRILKGGKVALVVSALFATLAFGAPTGGSISSGSASITANGTTTTITQTTDKASINWQSFSVAPSETVNFVQPSSSSVTLNRVIGNDASTIAGHLNANGQVFLLNPNGVIFTKGSQINVGGIVASTLNMSDTDFNSGNYVLSGTSTASVLNQGDITTANGGYVVLAAKSVTNEGAITSQEGNVQLASGSQISLNINGNSLLSLTIDKGTYDTLVSNKGIIQADGGSVYLTSKAMNSVLNGVVNNSGVIQAQGIGTKNGKIVLFAHGGTTQVSGTLDASASNTSNGGFIETSGLHVNIADGTNITTKASNGNNGLWLIDPVDFTIAASGGDMTGATLSSSLGSGSVTIQSSSGSSGTSGDINVNDPISWSAATKLTLSASNDIHINTTITASNAAGQVELDYGQSAVASGNTATYDFGLTSSGFAGSINLQAGNNFFTKKGSDGSTTTYTVITSLGSAGSTTGTDLQGINGNLTGNYVLGTNINASGTSAWNSGAGWTPIGNSSNFTGKFDGLGHTINALYINNASGSTMGLFGTAVDATIQNVGVTNVNIQGNDTLGGLVGVTDTTSSGTTLLANDYVTGSVKGTSGYIGGLAGGSYSEASSTNLITNSFSTATVQGNQYVGGLVGIQQKDNHLGKASITNSYATGSVTGTQYVGGFVGANIADFSDDIASIVNCYSTGAVTGTSDVGGLVGWLKIGLSGATSSVTNSFWNTTTSGKTVGVGTNSGTVTNLQGLTTEQMNFGKYYSDAGWSITINSALSQGAPTFNHGAWQIAPLTLSYTLGSKSTTYNGADQLLSGFYTSASTIFGSSYAFLNGYYHFTNGGSTVSSYKNAGTYNNIKVASDNSYLAISSSGNTDGALTINKAALTLTAQTNTKAYDATTTASATPAVSGLQGSDTVTGLSEVYSDKNAGTGKTLSVNSGYTISDGNSGNNYAVTLVSNTSGVISQKTLSLSATKTYDGTTDLTNDVTFNGLIGSETLGYSGATANSKDVGSGNYIAAITLQDGTGLASNYALPVLNSTNAPVTINPRSVTTSTSNTTFLSSITNGSSTQAGNDGSKKKQSPMTPPSDILSSTPFQYFYLGNILVLDYIHSNNNLQLQKKNGHFVIAQN